jgi:hypothetical protein
VEVDDVVNENKLMEKPGHESLESHRRCFCRPPFDRASAATPPLEHLFQSRDSNAGYRRLPNEFHSDTVEEFHFRVPETAVPPWEKPQPVPPVANKEKFEAMRDEFYGIRGWDPLTGVPTDSKLKELGLDDIAEGLAGDRSIGKNQ